MRKFEVSGVEEMNVIVEIREREIRDKRGERQRIG